MESILVGADRSEGSRRALRFALQRARVNEWKVTLVHVIQWSPYSFPTLEDNEKRPVVMKAAIERAQIEILDPLLSWAGSAFEDIGITTVIRHGKPSEVLADLASEEGHDMIFVGRTGDANLRVAIFGSTANRLAQHAPVPVVVVP
ncbi:universal stress protein [Geodermatophilus normandii]|uniref:Universal stress protein n=1 Tax=Geodermatophilus normandii TaxID=1137989 RepID=A0A6P0GIH1_9ACTN|nr:universal stress protein [Geodermatophilus normandii]NEM07069.1 universal stress protein [Geodermatophilus normandii]